MTRNCRNLRHLILPLFLALCASSPAIAQQGQYYINYALFKLPDMTSSGGLVTYSPIKEIDGDVIQLRGDDGKVYTFMLDTETLYCQGDKKVHDWTFLKHIGKKQSVTVMTNSDTDIKALVIWDRGPSISSSNRSFSFSLPPMCH
jgi:hypothetical protein